MDNIKTVVTEEGYQKLKEEYDQLANYERQAVIKELQAARAQGDLSENADYDAARDHQARVEARIRELEDKLQNVEIIPSNNKKGGKKTVSLGSTVKIVMLDIDMECEYSIVGTDEADPDNGKISNETPLAKALLDHKVDETVMVNVTKPYKVKIISIK